MSSIHKDGISARNSQTNDGYASDASAWSNSNFQMQGFLQNKFNSKRYAQKQIESLIDHRKQEMNTSVYAALQINQGVDTDDLRIFLSQEA